jgi:hypothetical protein
MAILSALGAAQSIALLGVNGCNADSKVFACGRGKAFPAGIRFLGFTFLRLR